jgi:hypothetical protein
MTLTFPHDVYQLGAYSLSYHAIRRFKQILLNDMMLPPDIIEKIEDEILPALEYISEWEPSDADIQAHIDSHGML